MEWTEKELAHICLLAESMKLEWFEDNFKKNNYERIDNFLKQWVNDGISYFGWTKDELGRMVACLKDVEMEEQNVVLKALPGGTESGTVVIEDRKMCNCALTSDWCGSGERCGSANCITQSWGCGTLLLKACDGRCRDNF